MHSKNIYKKLIVEYLHNLNNDSKLNEITDKILQQNITKKEMEQIKELIIKIGISENVINKINAGNNNYIILIEQYLKELPYTYLFLKHQRIIDWYFRKMAC